MLLKVSGYQSNLICWSDIEGLLLAFYGIFYYLSWRVVSPMMKLWDTNFNLSKIPSISVLLLLICDSCKLADYCLLLVFAFLNFMLLIDLLFTQFLFWVFIFRINQVSWCFELDYFRPQGNRYSKQCFISDRKELCGCCCLSNRKLKNGIDYRASQPIPVYQFNDIGLTY